MHVRPLGMLLMAGSTAFVLAGAAHWVEFRPAHRALGAAAPPSRVVHLLSFQDAQDRGDLGGMLEAAARLDAAGEAALGGHVRDAAAWAVGSGWVPARGGGRPRDPLDDPVGVTP